MNPRQLDRHGNGVIMDRNALARQLQEAVALHRDGALAAALSGYDAILRVQPDHVDALYLSGVIAAQQARARDALALMDKVIALEPGHAVALALRARALHMLGRLEDAVTAYDRCLVQKPDDADSQYNRGNALQALGRAQDALAGYDKAVALRPDYADAVYGQANALQALGRLDEALARYDAVLALKPDHAEAHSSRGNTLLRLGRLDEALASHERAIAIKPDNADAQSNSGNALLALGRPDAARVRYERAIALKPEHALARSGLGTALRDLGRLDEALLSYDRALALMPDHADTWSNRATALQALLRLDEALASYDRALALRPDHVDAQWNRSHVLLLSGDFARGWPAYESRWRMKAPSVAGQPWLGDAPLEGRSILLHSEQGLGDTIQFARYAPLVRALGARVILAVQAPLVRLMASLDAEIEVTTARDVAADRHCPLMSLPLAFGMTLTNVPAPPRYLAAEPALVETWRARLPPTTRPRIGLVWSGNPSHRNDRNRSLPLETLAPLLDSDAQWLALQKDIPDRDAALLDRLTLLDLGDFADTAALIEALDLVITVDTSVAHLAGALGKPTWILLPFCPDWRWLTGREDSPWYPSARLFRQTTPGDWAGVIRRVIEAL